MGYHIIILKITILDYNTNRPQRRRTTTFLVPVRPLWGRFLLLYACPQVPFPSGISPAVIESWPPPGTGGEILLVEIFLATLLDNDALGILAYLHASHIEGLGRLHRLRAGKLCDTCIGLVNQVDDILI